MSTTHKGIIRCIDEKWVVEFTRFPMRAIAYMELLHVTLLEKEGDHVEFDIKKPYKWNMGTNRNTCSFCTNDFFNGSKNQPLCKKCCETEYAKILVKQIEPPIKPLTWQEIEDHHDLDCTSAYPFSWLARNYHPPVKKEL